jgi:hypothetical protein
MFWFKVWGIGALATLIFLWGYLIAGYFNPEIQDETYSKHGGLLSMLAFCIVLACVWPYTIGNLLWFIKKHEAKEETP